MFGVLHCVPSLSVDLSAGGLGVGSLCARPTCCHSTFQHVSPDGGLINIIPFPQKLPIYQQSSSCSSNHHNAHGKMIHATCGLRAKRACMHSLPYVIVESRHHSLVQSDTQKEIVGSIRHTHKKGKKTFYHVFGSTHTHTP